MNGTGRITSSDSSIDLKASKRLTKFIQISQSQEEAALAYLDEITEMASLVPDCKCKVPTIQAIMSEIIRRSGHVKKKADKRPIGGQMRLF